MITQLKDVSKLAYVSKRVSDLSGVEADDKEFLEIIVRKAPGLEEAVKLDVLPSEIKNLKSAGELVVLEVKSNGDSEQVIVTVEEWRKLSPDIDKIVANADGVRGRRKGFRPSA